MVDKIKKRTGVGEVIDCACLIHDTLYDWSYVDKLYRSLCRNLTPTVRMHVYTESTRFVPKDYIRHDLQEWDGVRGPKRSVGGTKYSCLTQSNGVVKRLKCYTLISTQ